MQPVRQLTCILVVYALVASAACMPDVAVSADAPEEAQPASAQLSALEGRWQIHTQQSSDCPASWQHTLPSGVSHWTKEGDLLTIRAEVGTDSPMALWAVSPSSLERVTRLQVEDCEVTETVTLVIDQVNGMFASGVFSSLLHHSGDACRDLAGDAQLADQCETVVRWQAKRLSH